MPDNRTSNIHKSILILVGMAMLAAAVLFALARSRRHSTQLPSSVQEAHRAQESRPTTNSNFMQPSIALDGLVGRVQTSAGRPVPGAQICSALTLSKDSPVRCVRSGADGRFRLQGSAAMLLVSATGYQSLTHSLLHSASTRELVLTLLDGGARISGSVVDASGGPIAGALVRALGSGNEVTALGISDDDGQFLLSIAAGATRLEVRADGYSELTREVQAPLDGLYLMLAAAGSISGRVVAAASRAPVPDLSVRAWSGDGPSGAPRAVQTQPDGSFEISGLGPGRYALLARSENWRSEELWVSLGVAERVEGLELEAQAASRFKGRVRVAGEPCRDGFVQLAGAVFEQLPLDAQGEVTFEGLPLGTYELKVSCVSAIERSERLELAQDPATRSWDLDPGLRIAGATLTASGSPLARAAVELEPVGGPLGRPPQTCVSNERGEFTCGGLSSGQYDCRIGPGLPPRSEPVRVNVSPGTTQRVVLRAQAEATIRARVVGPKRLELPALALLARKQESPAVLGVLEGDEFVFSPLGLGSYEITSEATPSLREHVTLTHPGQVALVTISVPALHSISGRVVDQDGQGVPDAWVRVSSSVLFAGMREPSPALTGADGSFALSALVPGRYQISVSSRLGQARGQEVASNSRDVELRIDSYGALEGSLTGPAGESVADFVVECQRSGEDGFTSVVGARGRWSAPWLAPGEYQLTARAQRGVATKSVQLPAGGKMNVALQLVEAPRQQVQPASAVPDTHASETELPTTDSRAGTTDTGN